MHSSSLQQLVYIQSMMIIFISISYAQKYDDKQICGLYLTKHNNKWLMVKVVFTSFVIQAFFLSCRVDKRIGIYRGTYFSAQDVFEDDDLCTKLHEGKQDIEKGDLFVFDYKASTIEQKQLRLD